MRALHLPGVPLGGTSPFRFPDKPASPSDLQYTDASYPAAKLPVSPSQHVYLIRVLLTALTRGELTWQEILEPSRFQPHGGAIPGHDLVGIVESVVPAPTHLKPPKFLPGDRVWGLIDFDRDGAAAEYAIAYESEVSLAPPKRKPQDMPAEEWDERLATLPLSGLTAYQALFTHGRLPFSNEPMSAPTKRVLILGAAGSVGLPTLQLAKAMNFAVVATASTASAQGIASILDATTDTLVEYTARDYISIQKSFAAKNLPPVDLVVDCIGGETLTSLLLTTDPPLNSVLSPHSRVVTIAAPIKVYGESTASQIATNCAMAGVDGEVVFFIVKPSGEQLVLLTDLVRDGRLEGYIYGANVFELEEGREAMEVTEARGRNGGGKVVVRIARE